MGESLIVYGRMGCWGGDEEPSPSHGLFYRKMGNKKNEGGNQICELSMSQSFLNGQST